MNKYQPEGGKGGCHHKSMADYSTINTPLLQTVQLSLSLSAAASSHQSYQDCLLSGLKTLKRWNVKIILRLWPFGLLGKKKSAEKECERHAHNPDNCVDFIYKMSNLDVSYLQILSRTLFYSP